MSKINIAVFASGSGTNAEEIFKYFKGHHSIAVKGLLTNNPKALAIKRAERNNIPYLVFNKQDFVNKGHVSATLREWEIDALVLAGFLWLIPEYLIESFPDKIVNIHPALLPKFGGKGMYGAYVHQAVLNSAQEESGITIHLVNKQYDKGKIVFQEKCQVLPQDTAGTLAKRIHELEHRYYPKVIEQWLMKE